MGDQQVGRAEEYWMVTTGPEGELGINGGIMRRMDGMVTTNTVGVPDLDDAVARIQKAGGGVTVPRMAIPGIGYMAYCHDTEGNVFGVMQSDPAAS